MNIVQVSHVNLNDFHPSEGAITGQKIANLNETHRGRGHIHVAAAHCLKFMTGASVLLHGQRLAASTDLQGIGGAARRILY